MVIAANFRKFPEAMALQFPLRLGKPVWNTSRPTTRLGRAIRAAIGRAVKTTAALPWGERLALAGIGKKPAPQWVKVAASKARRLAAKVKAALMALDFTKGRAHGQEIGGFWASELADQSTKKPLSTIWRQTASGTCSKVACWL